MGDAKHPLLLHRVVSVDLSQRPCNVTALRQLGLANLDMLQSAVFIVDGYTGRDPCCEEGNAFDAMDALCDSIPENVEIEYFFVFETPDLDKVVDDYLCDESEEALTRLVCSFTASNVGPRHRFVSSDPRELQFSCAVALRHDEERLVRLLEATNGDARAFGALRLWQGHSRRYARRIIEVAEAVDTSSCRGKLLRSAVESDLNPKAVLRVC